MSSPGRTRTREFAHAVQTGAYHCALLPCKLASGTDTGHSLRVSSFVIVPLHPAPSKPVIPSAYRYGRPLFTLRQRSVCEHRSTETMEEVFGSQPKTPALLEALEKSPQIVCIE